MAVNLLRERAGAPEYPSRRFNKRERKLIKDLTSGSGLYAIAEYSFATHGGAIGTIDLGVQLPANAVVIGVLTDVLTAPDSATDTGTIRLNVATEGNLNSALTADGAASGVIAHTPNSASPQVPKKVADTRSLQVTIASEAITVGRLRYLVQYVISA